MASKSFFHVLDCLLIKDLISSVEIINETKFKLNVKKQDIPYIVNKLVENKVLIYGIMEEEKSLEDAFFEKTGGNEI